jgi:hypothetical protein
VICRKEPWRSFAGQEMRLWVGPGLEVVEETFGMKRPPLLEA